MTRQAAALLIAILAGCAPAPTGRETAAAPPVVRLSIHLAPDAPLATETGRPAIAVSRLGDRIVLVTRRGGTTELRLRPIEKFESIPLPGTEGAVDPFLSPHGDWVGFFSGDRLRRISLGSLEVQTICEVRGAAAGASWGPDDNVVFAAGGDLWRVPAGGGTPERIALPAAGARAAGDGRALPLWPDVSPGGGTIVFTFRPDRPEGKPAVAAFEPRTGELRILAEDAIFGRFAPEGHLVYLRQGNLAAVPFDAARLQPGSRAVPILGGVMNDARTAAAQFAVSPGGLLLYVPDEASAGERSLLWVDRKGDTRPVLAGRRDYELPRLSPDGGRLAISIAQGDTLAIWIHQVGTDRLQLYPVEGSGALPLFTPDGSRLVYVSPRAGAWNLMRRPADPAAARIAEPELLLSGENPLSPTSFSPAGDLLALTEVHRDSRGDILLLPAGSGREAGAARPFLRTPADEWGATFSPDGRLLAYTSNAGGRNEVYAAAVTPAAGDAAPARISRDGGYGPIWSRNGREIFFRNGDAVLAAPVTLRPVFSAGAPAVLFRGPYEGASAGWPNYDAAPDGRRFMMVRRKDDGAGVLRVDAVLGFSEELRRAVARGQE